jgi:hypothetical protein
MQAVDNLTLDRWRSLDAVAVLAVVTSHAKRDRSFVPTKDARTERWHVAYGNNEFELLVSGPKFFDTRAKQGGGGAVDLLMHLSGNSFKVAVKALKEAGL